MVRILFFLLLFVLWNCTRQPEGIVTVMYDLNNPEQKTAFEKWEKTNIVDNPNDSIAKRYIDIRNAPFLKDLGVLKYEDDNYKVYCGCVGEFGGAVYFEDKKSGNIHSTESTCPIMIDCRDGVYYITSTLAHLSGFTSLKSIDNPQTLTDSTGFRTLLDSGGNIANVFFPVGNDNYLVYSSYGHTLLGKVENQKLTVLDTLLPFPIWNYDQDFNVIKNGIYVSMINHRINYTTDPLVDGVTGKIYVKEDTLVVGYLKK